MIVKIRQTSAVLLDGRHRSKGSNKSKVLDALISSDKIIQSSGNFGFDHIQPGLD